jgi:hypothetical protein
LRQNRWYTRWIVQNASEGRHNTGTNGDNQKGVLQVSSRYMKASEIFIKDLRRLGR